MKRSNGLVLVAAVAGIMIWGCSKTSTGPSGPSTTDLIGKWIYSSVHITGTTLIHVGIQGYPDSTVHIDDTIAMSGTANYAQLYADMTYSMEMPALVSLGAPAADTGTWSLSGSSLRLIDTLKDTTNLSVSISGNNGTFVDSTSQRTNNPTGTIPGSYIQSTMITTSTATKQ
jgi:hypothetical protein